MVLLRSFVFRVEIYCSKSTFTKYSDQQNTDPLKLLTLLFNLNNCPTVYCGRM